MIIIIYAVSLAIKFYDVGIKLICGLKRADLFSHILPFNCRPIFGLLNLARPHFVNWSFPISILALCFDVLPIVLEYIIINLIPCCKRRLPFFLIIPSSAKLRLTVCGNYANNGCLYPVNSSVSCSSFRNI